MVGRGRVFWEAKNLMCIDVRDRFFCSETHDCCLSCVQVLWKKWIRHL